MGGLGHQMSLNTFWSISVCVLTLGLHGYAIYQAHQRYQQATSRFWPGFLATGGLPPELTAFLVLLILSTLCLPFFVLFSCLRVGNNANDGVKLGRDHALQPHLPDCCCCGGGGGGGGSGWRRVWRNFLPLAQTLQVTAAFLLLLPHTLLTAVEVRFGYKTSEFAWTSDVDFLFAEERAHVSDVKASVNKTHLLGNVSSVWTATYSSPEGTWPGAAGDHWMSLAFVNFVLALLAFSIRYAAVFWYTNKALTLVFALQLFTLTVTAVLGFSAFTCLYKVCSNQRLFLNVHLALSCHTSLTLYLLGSTIMLLSTLIVCEYGSHYFMEKMLIIERRHRTKPDGFMEASSRTGCQVYVPHMCALVALAFLVACKGPVMFDLVRMYRPTQDSLVLTGLVCEVLYMVLWIGLWFALTVKQQWQFRILDYMSLGQSLDSGNLEDEVIRRSTLGGHRGSKEGCFEMEMQDLSATTCPYNQNRDSTSSYHDTLLRTQEAPSGHVSFLPNGGLYSNRDNAGSLPNGRKSSHSSYLNVQAEMHNITPSISSQAAAAAGAVTRSRHCSGEGSTSQGGSSLEKQRKKDGLTESFKDYRNSIRSKCDDLYTTVDYGRDDGGEDRALLPSDTSMGFPSHEALPTLMSSFRDKVKESSRAANNYRQQRCSLNMGGYGSLENDSRKDHAGRRPHTRKGSWTPPHIIVHSSLERDSGKDRTHVRSSSWTHHQPTPSRLQVEGQKGPPLIKNDPRPITRPGRPSSSQGSEGLDMRVKHQQATHKSHSLPHSRQRQWPHGTTGGSRGRPRNNSLPSTPRRLQQVNAVYSVADQMARLRGGHREYAPSPRDAPSPGPVPPGSVAALGSQSGRLDLPAHADLASCPFMTSRATSTND